MICYLRNYRYYNFSSLLFYDVIGMKKFLVLLFSILLLLTGCGNNKNNDILKIKFWNFVLSVNDYFVIVNWQNFVLDKDFNVLYEYKEKDCYDKFATSFVIAEYIWRKPTDKRKFFNILVDKFQKDVPWSKIVDIDNFKTKWNDIYYFVYNVNNDIFWNIQDNYYGLQSYLFWLNEEIYVISYITKDDKLLSKFIDNLRNIEFISK